VTDLRNGHLVNVRSLLDGSSWSAYQKLVTGLAATVTIFDGFDIQILAFTIPLLTREWHVERSQFGPVLALGLVGMALWSLLAGHCGDRFCQNLDRKAFMLWAG